MRDEACVYRQAVAQVLAVLTDVDPYGLEPGTPEEATADGFEGAPADEYELEAVDIARILLREGAVTVSTSKVSGCTGSRIPSSSISASPAWLSSWTGSTD